MVVGRGGVLEILDERFHVLELAVELLYRFGVFTFLVLNLVSMRFHKPLKQSHQVIDVLFLVLFLDDRVDCAHKFTDCLFVAPNPCFF